MKIMLNHNSARQREEIPHVTRSTKNLTRSTNNVTSSTKKKTLNLNGTSRNTNGTPKNTISNALKRRAQSVIKDRSIDAQSRAIIRYGLETNDPWLPELVRRADAGETIIDTVDFSQTPAASDVDSSEEKIEALAEMICRAGDEPETKSAALLVLMATLEHASHPKALANMTKHLAFTRYGELNLCGMVDAQIARLEGELF
jgi:hypothetical protein